ncbi:PilX N-terminal domain-containing pilus assembly protein [Parahaliea aestuarii]|uniref:Type 4 fimbrial biogenesis protein PilX N-terminal domain-containing protein n=1 Tax=Parahaliea aestuarii TaxID=1852021 RepID=A0A5C8ZN70_9GAMM|nr:PilX N-terminal domain-containing pilus assembly protein [Parahaliea aestuarii]TXS89943.1 hypothetical protein FVW59_15125 [Parahaliea aestuarii]
MRPVGKRHGVYEQGVALVVSLLFLLVVTIISITAANNSSLGLKISANLQDGYQSFQAAEAGIYAALGLANGAKDPFNRRQVVLEPFDGVSPHPLRNVIDPNSPSVDVDVFLIAFGRDCPRAASDRGGSSVGTFDCDYYRVTSRHEVVERARTQVELGVVKTVVGESG